VQVKARSIGVTIAPQPKKEQCYKPVDFRHGTYIEVYNRPFFLHDSDGFTKAWYQQNLGFTDDDIAAVSITGRTAATLS
jgi:DUF1126 PH-like domain